MKFRKQWKGVRNDETTISIYQLRFGKRKHTVANGNDKLLQNSV